MDTALAEAPATMKQLSFIASLVKERDVKGTPYAGAVITTKDEASKAIGFLLSLPLKDGSTHFKSKKPNKEAHPGYYKHGEHFYEVVKSKQGRTYAKKLMIKTKGGSCAGHHDNLDGSFFQCGRRYPTTEQWKNLANVEDSDMPVRDFGCLEVKITRASWEFIPGAMKSFQEWEPLTKEEAAQFGKKYGVCMMCGRVLTNPASIEAGIGPICADKF